jgi:uncharacterized protein YbjT (DUF2867 family)
VGRVLVVGATGLVGGKVVDELLAEGAAVAALVRPTADPTPLRARGAEVRTGDLRDRGSLDRALDGVQAVVTTAYGYARRQPGDSLAAVDAAGNSNLIAAARRAGVRRLVFTSVLTADRAVSVPHFYQKARTEAELEASGVPFVALRPGGFVDTLLDASLPGIRRGVLRVPADPDAPASTILSDDVAWFLARAVSVPGIDGGRIDLGTERPTTLREVAATLSRVTGREVRVRPVPTLVRRVAFGAIGLFSPQMRDVMRAMAYVSSGQYVADVTRQREVFGRVPTLQDSVRRWARRAGLGDPVGA